MLSKAKSQALRYLARRPRSVWEMERYLGQKGYEQDLIQKIIQYLRRLGYLDDYQFCQLWIENRNRLKPMGRQRLYQELFQKGISRQKIADNLELHFNRELEYELAVFLVVDRQRIYKTKEKMAGFLYRRGFNREIIREVIAKNYINNNDSN